MKAESAIEFIARAVCVVDGRLLVCRLRGAPRSYLPGGHIDSGEGARAALRREIGEELGRKAAVGRFLAALEHHYTKKKGAPVSEINLVFETRIRGLDGVRPPGSMEEHIGFEWLPLSRLVSSDLEPWPLRRRLRAWRRRSGGAGWGSSYAEDVARR